MNENLIELTVAVQKYCYLFSWKSISKSKGNNVKIISVEKVELHAVIKELQDFLQHFVHEWEDKVVKNHEAAVYGSLGIPEDGYMLLRLLKRKGYDVFKKLLPLDRADADEVRKYIGGSERICITPKTILILPWGLLSENKELDIRNPGELEDIFNGFWGVKYRLSINPSKLAHMADDVLREVDFFSVLNRGEFSECSKELKPPEDKFSEKIMSLALPELEKNSLVADKVEEYNNEKSDNLFFYLFSHFKKDTGAGHFFFGKYPQHHLSLVDLSTFLEEKKAQDNTKGVLFFLNSCSSATEYAYYLVSKHENCIGCIVANSEVPKRFGHRFGMVVIDDWLQRGESLIEVVYSASKSHLPFGLFYTLYCGTPLNNINVLPTLHLMEPSDIEKYRQCISGINFSLDGAFNAWD